MSHSILAGPSWNNSQALHSWASPTRGPALCRPGPYFNLPEPCCQLWATRLSPKVCNDSPFPAKLSSCSFSGVHDLSDFPNRRLLTQPLCLECPHTQRSRSYKDFVKSFSWLTPQAEVMASSSEPPYFSACSCLWYSWLLVDTSHVPDPTGGPGGRHLALLTVVSFTTPSTMPHAGQVFGNTCQVTK